MAELDTGKMRRILCFTSSWLPQWGKMGPYHPLGISCVGPAIKSSLCSHNNKSLFDQACSVKMAR